jgi:hypothetical protein
MTAGVVAGVRAERRSRLFLGVAAAAVVLVAAWLAIGLLPDLPGVGPVAADVAERADLPATPAEAATRIVDGLGALTGAVFGALSVAGGAPVALVALALFLVVNGVVAGRIRLAGRSS